MPPSKDNNTKQSNGRPISSNSMSMSARVYHPATNVMPPSPPRSPSGVGSYGKTTTLSWGRQNSQNSKYS